MGALGRMGHGPSGPWTPGTLGPMGPLDPWDPWTHGTLGPLTRPGGMRDAIESASPPVVERWACQITEIVKTPFFLRARRPWARRIPPGRTGWSR